VKPPVPPRGAGSGLSAVPFAIGSLFAIFFFVFAWQPGVLRSDDFGYLRSIVGTLELGRPYTYDWLAPYGAVLSSVCAALYRLTGNFYLSTYGFQAFCVLADFFLLHRLLAKRASPRTSAALALAFTTFPVFFAKAADFHGSISTLALFLAALLCFGSGRPLGFFLAAFLAFANRQSHIALLILPGWAAAERLRGGSRGERVNGSKAGAGMNEAFAGWRTWLTGFAFLAAAAALHLRMNRTYAMANAVFAGSGSGRILSVTLAFLFGCFTAMAFLALCGAVFRSPIAALKANLERPVLPVAVSAALFGMSLVWPPNLIMTDTPMFGYAGWPQVNAAAPWILLACAWFLDYRLLRPSPYLALIGGFILIASLRGLWWDYYFLEILALCLLLAAHPGVPDSAPASLSRAGAVAVSLMLLANLGYAYLLRVQMDKQKLSVSVMEKLEREGKVSVDGMTGATFGYLGWKLFDYFLANEGRTFGELADFMGYVRRDRVVVETHLPWRHRFKGDLPAAAVLLDSGVCSIGFATVRYRVADLHGPASGVSIMGRPMTLDPARYPSRRFPIDNHEWTLLLDSLARAKR
jgi:hypothetical protein